MNILVFGDIIGRAGREAMREILPRLRADASVDVVIANGENLAHGRDVTADTAQELFDMGVSVLTGGNHTGDIRQGMEWVQNEPRVLRPANFAPGLPGRGSTTFTVGVTTIAVLNIVGRAFFREQYDDPIRAAEQWLSALPRVKPLITLVDVHAEATSEKRALGFLLDGKVTAVWGTHTHVPTADEQVLPGGTAYISDIGLTGALHSVLGFQIAPVLERFRTQMPIPFTVEESRPWEVNAILLDVDERTGTARGIRRIREILAG